ncbi:MAG: universal stress protein [Deltaproteobacteria bacterium]|nr:universal stress protein [Deltaproteobacteria bacterium]
MVYKKILAALDPDGEGTPPVFEHALKLVQTHHARLMLLGCMDPRTQAEIEDRIGTVAELDSSSRMGSLKHQAETERSRCRAWLGGLAKQAEQNDVSVRTTVDVGNPGQRITELAQNWKADLIVIGLTRRGPVADRLLGSVTSYVVHHAPCSVLLIHG